MQVVHGNVKGRDRSLPLVIFALFWPYEEEKGVFFSCGSSDRKPHNTADDVSLPPVQFHPRSSWIRGFSFLEIIGPFVLSLKFQCEPDDICWSFRSEA